VRCGYLSYFLPAVARDQNEVGERDVGGGPLKSAVPRDKNDGSLRIALDSGWFHSERQITEGMERHWPSSTVDWARHAWVSTDKEIGYREEKTLTVLTDLWVIGLGLRPVP
jgi:hypothetical protein